MKGTFEKREFMHISMFLGFLKSFEKKSAVPKNSGYEMYYVIWHFLRPALPPAARQGSPFLSLIDKMIRNFLACSLVFILEISPPFGVEVLSFPIAQATALPGYARLSYFRRLSCIFLVEKPRQSDAVCE